MEAVMIREISVEDFSIFSDSMITGKMYGCFGEVIIASYSKTSVYETVTLKNMIKM